MNVNFKQLLEKQDAETYQLALLAIIKKSGGIIALSKQEILDAYKLVGTVDEINGKLIIKTSPKPVDFDQNKAQEFFDAAVNEAINARTGHQ